MPADASIYQGGTLANPVGGFLQGVAVAQREQAQRQQLDLQQQAGTALADDRRAMAEQRELANAKAQRDAAEEAKLREVFASGTVSPGAVFSIVGPQRGAEILKGLGALQEQNQKAFKNTQEIVGTVIPAIKALPEGLRPDAYTMTRNTLISRGVVKPEDVPEQYDPAFLDQAHQWALTPEQQYAEGQPKLTSVPQGGSLIDAKHPEAGPVYTAPAKPPTLGSFEDYVARYAGERHLDPKQLSPKDIEQARKLYQQSDDRPRINVNAGDPTDVKEFVAGMKDGTLPPQMPGRASKDYAAIMAEAHRQGYDLAGAVTDWMATQKHIATMNGAQQLRLNQAVNALPDMLDKVDALASKWKGGRFPILNSVNLKAAKAGAYGQDVASIANQLDAQIADVTADLGNVYMGGNSPTDHALGLAGKSLKGEWSEKVLHDMVALAKQNVTIRRNSINSTGVAGASADNPYAPKPADAAKADPLGIR